MDALSETAPENIRMLDAFHKRCLSAATHFDDGEMLLERAVSPGKRHQVVTRL